MAGKTRSPSRRGKRRSLAAIADELLSSTCLLLLAYAPVVLSTLYRFLHLSAAVHPRLQREILLTPLPRNTFFASLQLHLVGALVFCCLQRRKSPHAPWFYFVPHLGLVDVPSLLYALCLNTAVPLFPRPYLLIRSLFASLVDLILLSYALAAVFLPVRRSIHNALLAPEEKCRILSKKLSHSLLWISIKKHHKRKLVFVAVAIKLLPKLPGMLKHVCRDLHTRIAVLNETMQKADFDNESPSSIICNIERGGREGRFLGHGLFYEVHEIIPFDDQPFARKSLNRKYRRSESNKEDSQFAHDNLIKEGKAWKHMQLYPYRHIASLKADNTGEYPPSIDTVPVGQYDLDTFLRVHCYKSSSPALKKKLLGWFGCARNLVEHLHDCAHVLHNDIKASNFIIRDFHLYLIDFGTSEILKAEFNYKSSSRIDNSHLFRAPEFSTEEDVGVEADIFSLGILFLYMLTALCEGNLEMLHNGKPKNEGTAKDPRWGMTVRANQAFGSKKNLQWIVKRHLPSLEYERVQTLCSREDFDALKSIIISMMDHNHTRRPKASQIKLPPSFQARCCSSITPSVQQTSPKSLMTNEPSQTHLQLPGMQIPVVIEPPSSSQEAKPRPRLLSQPSSSSSFPFSQSSTVVPSRSPALSSQNGDQSPIPSVQLTSLEASRQGDLQGLALDRQLKLQSDGPWTPESPPTNSDDIAKELQELYPRLGLETRYPSTGRSERRYSGNDMRRSISRPSTPTKSPDTHPPHHLYRPPDLLAEQSVS